MKDKDSITHPSPSEDILFSLSAVCRLRVVLWKMLDGEIVSCMEKINHAITKKYPHQPGSQQKPSDKIHRILLPPLDKIFIRRRENTKMPRCFLILCHKLLFTQNLFLRFSPHFIKFDVGREVTHWGKRCLVYGLRIYQNFTIIFLNCQTKLGLIKFIYSMVKVYQTILIHGLKQFSWKLKHFHTREKTLKGYFLKGWEEFVLFFHRINILLFISSLVCWRQRAWVKQ